MNKNKKYNIIVFIIFIVLSILMTYIKIGGYN